MKIRFRKAGGSLRVFEIGRDYLLGVWRDEYDVEHVQLYDLLKPGAEMVAR